jgi:hypothetical protein
VTRKGSVDVMGRFQREARAAALLQEVEAIRQRGAY